MADAESAEIKVAKDSRRAEHEDLDEYDISVVNPFGEHPSELLSAVEEQVREVGDLARLSDGEAIRNFGYVKYTANEIVEIEVWDGYKR